MNISVSTGTCSLMLSDEPGRWRRRRDVLEHDPADAAAFFVHFGQAMLQEDFDTGFGDPATQDFFRDVGFESPLLVFSVVLPDLAVESRLMPPIAALFPESVNPSPPVVMPPRCRLGSMRRTERFRLAAATAATTPAAVPP